MARRCLVSGKSVMSGNNVSHSKRHTRRRFLANLQRVTLLSDALGVAVQLRLSTRGIRTVEINGGIDSYLLNASSRSLTDEARKLRKRVMKAAEKRQAAAAAA